MVEAFFLIQPNYACHLQEMLGQSIWQLFTYANRGKILQQLRMNGGGNLLRLGRTTRNERTHFGLSNDIWTAIAWTRMTVAIAVGKTVASNKVNATPE